MKSPKFMTISLIIMMIKMQIFNIHFLHFSLHNNEKVHVISHFSFCYSKALQPRRKCRSSADSKWRQSTSKSCNIQYFYYASEKYILIVAISNIKK
jgi:hypothetical protein